MFKPDSKSLRILEGPFLVSTVKILNHVQG